MYRKTADLHHFHERTASHATKGSGRGAVWWNTADGFDPAAAYRDLCRQRSVLKRQYWNAASEMSRLLQMTQEAVERRDQSTIEALRPSIRVFSKNMKRTRKELEIVEAQAREMKIRRNALTK